MKPKYWTIFILASAAIIASVFYYLRQPAPYSGLIVVPHVVKVQQQATTTSQTDLQSWQTYRDSLFSINILSNWVASTTMANASSQPDDPLKTVSFALPSDLEDPVLYIQVYRPGVKFTDVDEPPTLLGSNGQYDFYFQKRNADSDPTTLTPLNLTDDELQNDLTQSIASFQSTTPTSPATSSPTTEVQIDTSGWQTYTNSQYGFSFEYPSTTSPSVDPSNTDLFDLKVFYNNKTENNPYLGTVPAFAGFEVQATSTNVTDIKAWLDVQYAGGVQPDETPTLVDGVKGIAVNETVSEGSCGSDYSAVIKNGYAYKIIDCSDNESGSNLMFNSFKFKN